MNVLQAILQQMQLKLRYFFLQSFNAKTHMANKWCFCLV